MNQFCQALVSWHWRHLHLINFEIFKKYPSTLYIDIKETKLIAKINKDSETFYIGTNGKLSKKKIIDEKLPFIFGKPNSNEFIKVVMKSW